LGQRGHALLNSDVRIPIDAAVSLGAHYLVECALEAGMTHRFDVVVERDSAGFFVATVPALPGCHTQARSLDELMSRIREAIELCIEVQCSPGESMDFVGVQRVTVTA
jgi:predicted RNase H-like HicB family nuclease